MLHYILVKLNKYHKMNIQHIFLKAILYYTEINLSAVNSIIKLLRSRSQSSFLQDQYSQALLLRLQAFEITGF